MKKKLALFDKNEGNREDKNRIMCKDECKYYFEIYFKLIVKYSKYKNANLICLNQNFE